MVNLRAIANQMTRTINPNLMIGWRQYSSVTVQADGKVTPSYAASVSIEAQVQALSRKSIEHLASLNISDCTREVYANAQIQATDRKDGKGGDLLTFEGSVWLVRAVLEGWTTAGWSHVAVSRQLDVVAP